MYMNTNDVEPFVRALRLERAELARDIHEKQSRLRALSMTLSGLYEIYPELAPKRSNSENSDLVNQKVSAPGEQDRAVSSDRPTGQEAVLRLLSLEQFRGRYWTVAAVVEGLTRLGWQPDSANPSNAVRVALNRLAESNPQVTRGMGRNGHLVYFYQFDADSPPHFDEH